MRLLLQADSRARQAWPEAKVLQSELLYERLRASPKGSRLGPPAAGLMLTATHPHQLDQTRAGRHGCRQFRSAGGCTRRGSLPRNTSVAQHTRHTASLSSATAGPDTTTDGIRLIRDDL